MAAAMDLEDAILEVARGQMHIPAPAVLRLMVAEAQRERRQPALALTDRELQVFNLVARALTYKEIASILHIKERTVKFHAATIFRKLHIHSRGEIARIARRRQSS